MWKPIYSYRAVSIGLWTTVLVLGINSVRLLIPMVRAQIAVARVVPYTVVLRETITDGSGKRHLGPVYIQALRADGSTARRFGKAGEGSRQLQFASGEKVMTNDVRHLKSTTHAPAGGPRTWLRDPKARCALNMDGEPIIKTALGQSAAQGDATIQVVSGYRTAKIQAFSSLYWFAIDHGCALVKSRTNFGADGFSESDLVLLIAGEPDEALFAVTEFQEGPPSSLVDRPKNCGPECQEAWRAQHEALDNKYYAHKH